MLTLNDIYNYIDEKKYESLERDLYEDLAEVYLVDPKSDAVKRVYRMAWEYGHAHGYRDVISYYDDLVKIIFDSVDEYYRPN